MPKNRSSRSCRRKALALLTGALLLATSAPGLARSQTLRVAVEGEYPPFNTVTAGGTFSGFDVEIAHALCAAMQASCKLVKQQWDRMIPDLVAGRYEMIVSSMSITVPRLQQIDFSDPYYQTPAKFVAKKGAALDRSLEDLRGKRVGVQKATNHEQYLASSHPWVALTRYETIGKATAALRAGKIDYLFGDAMALDKGFLKTLDGKGFAFVGPDMRDPRYFGRGFAVAVQKGNAELRGRLNQALATIKANGRYDAIQKKYFVFDMAPTPALASVTQ
jgi:lysine-arginine-ornithine-binding protein